MKKDDLYFILNPALGIVKIGIAADAEARRIQLEHACGIPLEILRVVEGAAEYEQDLHDAFGPTRLRGEWFQPTDEILELATGTADIVAFLASKRQAIAGWRAARDRAKSEKVAAQREASREETAAAAHLEAERTRLKRERDARKERARVAEEKVRREQQAQERARIRDVEQARVAAEIGLPVTEASRVAKDRRASVAQRFRNSSLIGLRRPEIIPALDLKRSAR